MEPQHLYNRDKASSAHPLISTPRQTAAILPENISCVQTAAKKNEQKWNTAEQKKD